MRSDASEYEPAEALRSIRVSKHVLLIRNGSSRQRGGAGQRVENLRTVRSRDKNGIWGREGRGGRGQTWRVEQSDNPITDDEEGGPEEGSTISTGACRRLKGNGKVDGKVDEGKRSREGVRVSPKSLKLLEFTPSGGGFNWYRLPFQPGFVGNAYGIIRLHTAPKHRPQGTFLLSMSQIPHILQYSTDTWLTKGDSAPLRKGDAPSTDPQLTTLAF
ncbi:uncharacterized protein BO72DRAFT_272450 [Aspergillus fijiensis CBS 313.89]|uniref:Uncharacterized protein n=1 Tax=Aspergillus fijiensis CBS 313.89 TaxID=1448319 RepID=A0A8G1RFZ7_9EURO|nr:uncharacterized protein BO72DRAFT_272450 [Aspergillus fijiensis CBS 313.89]RAK72549.1 hypothetical protein BO72DRAFT_272450 [Aspergillus fijiensis CBS 313.89]